MKVNEIKEQIEIEFDLDDLHKRVRYIEYVVARGLFNYIMHVKEGYSMHRIARKYGYCHATIINSIKKFKQLMKFKNEFTQNVDSFLLIYNGKKWEDQKK